MSHLHEMGVVFDGSDSGNDPHAYPGGPPPPHEDVEMGGNGSSGSGTESHCNESHGNRSRSNESVGGSSSDSKDSALMGSSGSNESSNSQSSSPPSSSNAYSLLSSEQDHPSTSGCSSEQSAKAKEMFKTLKRLKHHLPAEKRSKGRASTLHTLRYALRCVKQVKANEEYYQMLMVNDSLGLDVSSYTIDEINSIMSEYTLKNTDIFAVAVSLISGRIVYISDQAAAALHCRRDEFTHRKFVEFVMPQDLSVFHSYTTPYRLPAWSMCTGAESAAADLVQEKSFFCRISGGKEKDGDLQYYPFRMTPYLMKVQDIELSEEHFCCLILAERVHSGYEAPRIPTDKRMFTTTHTPNCVFQDVDERAVPLLGYLPQDLIGTPILLHIHSDDRATMLAVHRKILQYMGQPFESSMRFCTRSGEFITMDTSWSGFINPWSRKVSFIIGRHTVRMGPVNEDVFTVPTSTEGKMMDSDIQEITEQIHKILMQPVHSLGSSGYGSHGSNNEHMQSVTSSSDSSSSTNAANERGKTKPRSFQEICKGVQLLKMQDQQTSALKSDQKSSETGLKSPCVRLKDAALVVKDGTAALRDQSVYSYQQVSCLDAVIRYLESCNTPITVKRKYQFSSSSDEEEKGATPPAEGSTTTNGRSLGGVVGGALALRAKAESVVSITSQCSYSSTIVQPDPEIMEDMAEGATPPSPVAVTTPGVYRKVGLTKQVLAAHTQTEEQVFLRRCKELCCKGSATGCAGRESGQGNDARLGAEPPAKKATKPRVRNRGLDHTPCSPSEASGTTYSVPYPALVPVHPPAQAPPTVAASPVVTPVLAFVLPDYVIPQLGVAPGPPFYQDRQNYDSHNPLQQQQARLSSAPQPAYLTQDPLQPPQTFLPPSGSAQAPPPPLLPHTPPLFGSHCSSPLQLDLLQLEEGVEPPGNRGALQEKSVQRTCCLDDGARGDALSVSSELMELLSQEDSGSFSPASNSCHTSRSATGSSRYFGSVDSWEREHKKWKGAESGQDLEYTLQDPLWRTNVDHRVLMTYQVPPRDVDRVLREDRERLRRLQRRQPRFTADQRRELVDQHPWMRTGGGLPKSINIKDCLYCTDSLEDHLPDMNLGLLRATHKEGVSHSLEEEGQAGSDSLS